MLPEQFIYVGIFLNVVLASWYIRTIFTGHTKPNLISWFMWTLAPLVGFFLQIKAGAGLSSSGVFVAGFFPLLTIIICLFRKDSYWKISLFDLFCGFLSIFALLLYVLTHNFSISILFAIVSDAFAYVPTLIKAWKFPETESSSTYLGGILNNFFAVLIIKNWSFPIYSFPLYLLISNSIAVCIICRKKIFKN